MKKLKYFWDPPPKKRLRDMNLRDKATWTTAINTCNVLVACWV